MYKKGKWNKEEIDFLIRNNNLYSTKIMSEFLNRDEQSIRHKRMKLGLKKERDILINPYQKQWVKKDIDFIVENFEKMSYSDLSKSLGRTQNSVKMKCKRLGLRRESEYFYDKSFFGEINTEEKAYWLGFIYADGYINYGKKDSKSSSYELGIELSIKDIEHLKKFNKSINGNLQIRTRFRDAFGKTFEICSIRIHCKEMVEDLLKQGICQNKSYLENNLPNLSKDMMIPFLRGYFDGDGCVCEDKKLKALRFDYCSGLKNILLEVQRYLYENYDIKSYISEDKPNQYSPNIRYRLNFRGLYNGYNFGNLIYGKSNIYLNRKYNLFNRFIFENNVKERILNGTNIPQCQKEKLQ